MRVMNRGTILTLVSLTIVATTVFLIIISPKGKKFNKTVRENTAFLTACFGAITGFCLVGYVVLRALVYLILI